MLGRSSRKNRQGQQLSPDAGSIHGTGSLIGGSGVSLDGQSLQLPEYTDYGDEVSSIATSNYGGQYGSSLHIVGSANNFDDDTDMEDNPFGDEKTPATAIMGAVPAGTPTKSPPSEESGDDSRKAAAGAGGCFPGWLTGAPNWLKGVMILSLLLLVAAAALLAVGAATSDDGGGNSSRANDGVNPPSPIPSIAPVTGATGAPSLAPVTAATGAPSLAPVTEAPSIMPFPGQTEFPTSEPSTSEPTAEPLTSEPSLAPTTMEPTALPSAAPTDVPTSGPDTSVTFYATAWRFQGAALAQVEDGLPLLPRANNEFMVHLGDWNSPSITSCDQDSYVAVAELYEPGPPTFFVVGDNEYNDCPNPVNALELWEEYLVGYENSNDVPLAFPVTRQTPNYSENFAFVYQQVLFVGINLVGGDFHDAAEWRARHSANLQWIDENYNENDGDIGALVIFAHAGPTLQANAPFYDGLVDFVSGIDLPTIVVNRNLVLEEWGSQENFRGVPGFTVLTVEGALWPPMRVELNVATGEFLFNQDTWLEDALADGQV